MEVNALGILGMGETLVMAMDAIRTDVEICVVMVVSGGNSQRNS